LENESLGNRQGVTWSDMVGHGPTWLHIAKTSVTGMRIVDRVEVIKACRANNKKRIPITTTLYSPEVSRVAATSSLLMSETVSFRDKTLRQVDFEISRMAKQTTDKYEFRSL
jgi:hypothetical protein